MRQLLFGSLMILTACGTPGDRPWDENGDGLITACEGLNRQACDATPGCEREPTVCILLCRDDGHGGCLPCPESDVCRPVLPPPPRDCAQLSASQCGAAPQCELVTETVCSAGSANGAEVEDRAFAPPAEPRCGNECHTVQRCQPRAPTTCEQRTPEQCLSVPGCAIVHDVAPSFAPCAPGSNCERPEVDPLPRCITVRVPTACEERAPDQCTADGRCLLESGPVCDVACFGEDCPACTQPAQRCVPLPVPSECASRDLTTCERDSQCRVEWYACPAVCLLLPDGGCQPCNAPPAACVPALTPEPVQCELLDEASCEASGCELLYSDIACTTECRDDGDGGCLPCPNFVCRGR